MTNVFITESQCKYKSDIHSIQITLMMSSWSICVVLLWTINFCFHHVLSLLWHASSNIYSSNQMFFILPKTQFAKVKCDWDQSIYFIKKTKVMIKHAILTHLLRSFSSFNIWVRWFLLQLFTYSIWRNYRKWNSFSLFYFALNSTIQNI